MDRPARHPSTPALREKTLALSSNPAKPKPEKAKYHRQWMVPMPARKAVSRG